MWPFKGHTKIKTSLEISELPIVTPVEEPVSTVVVDKPTDDIVVDNSVERALESLEPEKPNFPMIRQYPLREDVEALVIKEASSQLKYVVVEPVLAEAEEKSFGELEELLVDELNFDARRMGSGAENYVLEEIEKLVRKYRINVSDETFRKIKYYVARDFVHYGKIDPLMRDPNIEDISCNGHGIPIYIWHREFESIPTNVMFSTAEELDRFVVKLADMTRRSVSIAQPVVDATLPDGSRIHVTYEKEVTRRGSSFTIRKFRKEPLTITDLVLNGTLSAEMAAWFWFVIEKQASIIVVGGTASGKTTLVNVLSMFIKPASKIISIEDTAELQLPHGNWLPSVVRSGFGVSGKQAEITLFDLLKNAMRQRPEYLIVGEVRGSEAYTLFQAMATGHGGLATLHAESVESTIRRLESEPMNIPRSLITTLDAIVVIRRMRVKDKSVRRILSATEITGLDTQTKELLIKEVFGWAPKTDSHTFRRRSHLLAKIVEEHGLSYDDVEDELKNRRDVIEWMCENNLHDFKDVGEVIQSYYADPLSLKERMSK